MKSRSRLEQALTEGRFAVTAELGPPQGNDAEAVKKKAAYLKGCVEAVNVTDNQSAVVRMSSLAASAILVGEGLEPVYQMTCRDRNRIAMQSDILGATALGIRNMLCLSGDHQSFGNQPHAKGVFDLDSTQLVQAARRMRDEQRILDSDKELEGSVPLFIGGAANPFAQPIEFRALRFGKKVDAGLDFVQTQCIFDMGIFRNWMKTVRDMGLHERCYILAGVIPLKSVGMAKYMAHKIAGVIIPDEILRRMSDAPKGKAAEEGIRICCELMEELREMEGVHGIHLMAIEWEHRVPEILERADLLDR